MTNYYSQILSLMDTLNEWNEKLNSFAASHMDNVWVGTAIGAGLLVLAIWGISALNKN